MDWKLYGWILLLLFCLPLEAKESYCFRVYLKDKGSDRVDVAHPEKYLSAEALERRERQGISIDSMDLPIKTTYLDTLREIGGRPVVQSRWFNTVVVEGTDSLLAHDLQKLPMVDSVKLVWQGDRKQRPGNSSEEDALRETRQHLSPSDSPLRSPYGYAEKQIRMLAGEKLHRAGFRGEGMRVAVIDAGFDRVDRLAVFDSLRLQGTHNIVEPGQSVFRGDDHGTKVLSCLAAYLPGIYIGTAPRADYWLIRSEDSRDEFPIEEDYWVAAVEYADSVGAEVITSSLGYFIFETKDTLYRNSDLNGCTAFISRAAQRAADKGLLLFCSAGNEGASDWNKITMPADAEGIATIGSVTDKRQKSRFSSIGPTADGRIKPDLVALGTNCCVIDTQGEVSYASGTSFATPTLAGLGICLWQALPHLSNRELISLLQQAGSQAKHPDGQLGYGVPNVFKAYKKEKKRRTHVH